MKKKTILLGLIMAGTLVVTTSCGKSSSSNNDGDKTTTQESQKPADQHSIYYIVDGKVVNTVNYKDGDTSVIELGVPKKEGYEGVWSNYTLNGDDIYVVAIYYKKNVNYKIEYYLQNLDDDNYTKDANYVGQFTTTEGKTIKPEIRQYVGFTCINSEVEQTIDEENNTIKVYYSRNLFTVNYTTNNGTTIQEETVKYGKILNQPNITKNGYTFINWTSNNSVYDFTKPVTSNLNLVCNWQANDNIQYKINYYLENLDNDEYTLDAENSKSLTANADEIITASVLTYDGFDYEEDKSNTSETISYDGTTELNVYYRRKRFTVNYVTNNSETIAPETVKYGAKLTSKTLTKQGYDFDGFKYDEENLFDFNNAVYSNLTLTASFSPKNVSYKINYYLEKLNTDGYDLSSESINSTAKTGTNITIDKLFQGFNLDTANSDLEAVVKPDGSTVLNVYYKRKQFTVDFVSNGGTELESLVVKYGQVLTEPTVSKEGYYYSCFKSNDVNYNFNNPVTTDLVLEAYYIPNNYTAYKVEFYYDNILNDEYTKVDETTEYGTTGELTPIVSYSVPYGFDISNPEQQEIIKGDGSTIVKYYYKRKINTIYYVISSTGEEIGSTTAKYETPYRYVMPSYTKEGYSISYYSGKRGYLNEDYLLDDCLTDCQDDTIRLTLTANPTTYKVEYYLENILDDEYTLDEERTQIVDSYTDYDTNWSDSITGFTLYEAASITSAKVKPDGSTVLKFYFKRNQYTVKYITGDDSIVINDQVLKYGTKLNDPNISKTGYTLNYWYNNNYGEWDFDECIVYDNMQLQAYWTANSIQTKVEYYLENLVDDGYTLSETEYVDTTVDQEYEVSYDTPTGFTFNSNTITTAYINADGSTVFKLYFNRQKYNVYYYSWNDDGNYELSQTINVKYNTVLTEPELSYEGYDIVGYAKDNNYDFDFSTPITSSIHLYAQYTPREDTKYLINIYYEHIEDNEYELVDTFYQTGTTDEYFENTDYYQNNMQIENYSVQNYDNSIINRKGDSVVNIYYRRKRFNIIVHEDEHVSTNVSGEHKYGETIKLEPVFDGNLAYNFLGIYDENDGYYGKKYNFTLNENVEFYLKTEEKEELANFKYTSSSTDLSIDGYKDDYFDSDLVIPSCATSISSEAFKGNELTSITLGDNIKIIEVRAFKDIPNDVEVYFNDGLEIIGSEAFYNTKIINEIDLPQSLIRIDDSSFYNCDLTYIYLPQNLEEIGSYAFSHDLGYSLDVTINKIPSSVTTIGGCAFRYLNLNQIAFEENSSLERIGSWAFSQDLAIDDGANVYDIVIPNSVKEIADYAFYGVHFNSLEFEENSQITKIDSYAFQLSEEDDILISEIILPSSITKFGYNVFGYRHFESFKIEDGFNPEFGFYSFGYMEIDNYYYCDSFDCDYNKGFYEATKINTLIIPNNIQTIKSNALFGSKIKELVFEEDSIVEKIEDSAFHNCGIEKISLPNSLKEIGEYAFYNCELTFVEIPDSVEKIGSYAFSSNGLIKILTLGQGLYEISDTTFNSSWFNIIFNKSIFELKEGGVDEGLISIGDALLFEGEDVNNVELKDDFVIMHKNGNENHLLKYVGTDEQITIPNYITHIDEKAFYYNDIIVDVVISNHVLEIGEYAFSGCKNLISVVIGNSVTYLSPYAFGSCDNLESVDFGTSLQTIGSYAFNECYKLDISEFNDNITTIENFAFSYCHSITNLTLDNNISIGEYAFYYCKGLRYLVIGDSITELPNYAFNGCKQLTTVVLGANVETIGSWAFDNCNALVEIYNRSELELTPGSTDYGSIAYHAKRIVTGDTFESYASIDGDFIRLDLDDEVYLCAYTGDEEDVVIPDYYTIVGAQAFEYSDIKSITLGENIKEIEKYAFYEARNLTEVIFNENIKTIGSSSFSRCYSLMEVTLPDSVETIEAWAFTQINTNLIVTVGSGLKTIKKEAFEYSLKELRFSGANNIEYIGDGVFKYSGLSSIELGENLTYIGSEAFAECKLLEIKNDSSLVLTIGSDTYGMIAKNCYNIYSSNSGESWYSEDSDGFTYFTINPSDPQDVLLTNYVGESGSDFDLTIPSNVTIIYENVFKNLQFNTITISKNVKEIGYYAFNCVTSKKLIFEENSNLTKIGDYAFYSFNFDRDEGVLQDEFRIPYGVVEIGRGNFQYLRVEKIYIPSTVTTIGSSAFFNCSYVLKYIIFDENLTITEIDNSIFDYCAYDHDLFVVIPTSITTIGEALNTQNYTTYYLYYGTEEQWNTNVTVGHSYPYVVYFYSEEEPDSEGNYWHFDDDGTPVLWEFE